MKFLKTTQKSLKSFFLYFLFCFRHCNNGALIPSSNTNDERLTLQSLSSPSSSLSSSSSSSSLPSLSASIKQKDNWSEVQAVPTIVAWSALAVSTGLIAATSVPYKEFKRSNNIKTPRVVLIDKKNITKTLAEINAAKQNAAVMGMAFVYPGTKWCGNGNLAESQDDLGESSEEDSCCRAHDLCPLVLHGGETKDGATNQSPFTVLDCNCDIAFYKCLDKIESDDSMMIKYVFFTLARGFCIEKQHPRYCVRKKPLSWTREFSDSCAEWHIETNLPQRLVFVEQKAPKVPFSNILSTWNIY